jgi:hypothetical protein
MLLIANNFANTLPGMLQSSSAKVPCLRILCTVIKTSTTNGQKKHEGELSEILRYKFVLFQQSQMRWEKAINDKLAKI